MTSYFEKWFWAKRRGIGPLSAQEAEERHRSGRAYVAVFVDDGVKRVIDFASPWVSVTFLDPFERPFLQYDFKKNQNSVLFLSLVRHTEFNGDGKDPKETATFSFKEDGSLLIENMDHEAGTASEKETSFDPQDNKEPYPMFGEYGSVARLDR